jgi:hypothetical protein
LRLKLYAFLALKTGRETERRDVHDEWAVWKAGSDPDKFAPDPFVKLEPDIQELDQPFVDAIHSVAAALL